MTRLGYAATVGLALAGAMLALNAASAETLRVGAPAPDFRVVDSDGKMRSLGEFKGKTVVMEWTSNACPYVRKHYGPGNMQALQKKYTSDGVVWLTVASSPPDAPGFVTGEQANEDTRSRGAAPTAVLLDHQSQVSRLYQARNTPLMVVVDAKGTLAYMGAIDDKPSTDPADIKGARNYVAQALDELKAGKPVSMASTRAYGCYVKYAPQS
ncbi:MAG: redoxin family protein [Alphaproteobacteria bacterium]|nr:redoxin family protein [Alphaproteobacteria bacterium]